MRVVILAGGFGSRLSEETQVRPKPMVEIGGKPILWHIMKIYSAHGLTDFVVCCGYKGHVIKEYFANYFLYHSDFRIDFKNNQKEVLRSSAEEWSVTLVDTGEKTMTGGRLKRVRDHIGDGTFCATYGDGVSDVDITKLLEFHSREKALATLTAIKPPGRFGAVNLGATQTRVENFHEKPGGDGAWVNGGFFVIEPQVLDSIEGDETSWEREPLERLATSGELAAYKHRGFWQPMDSLRDKIYLEELWSTSAAPWKVW